MTPPPESYEKRQRDRKKQRKRKEKLERKLQRKSEKRYGGMGPEYHTLVRGNDQLRLATDMWLSVLDLAAVGGWVPPEAGPNEEPSASAFARPAGLKISEEVAKDLAKTIEQLIPSISESELPYSNSPFGEHHTEDLLSRRAEGERLALEDAATAQEILSGPTKSDVAHLAAFLKAGGLDVEAS